ncbi:hypothetical protein RQM59_08085 [Flavobacteriaceae bacterium S356]|uniref:SGNH/GDSL hydrolase family protein n=1 Tax=Asprobacillus argus TaxID=3076534 RepID=A0ABU3LFA4_9FLAO|nr:hypothetical protein [Flavobacteriaceae bacterium S356]
MKSLNQASKKLFLSIAVLLLFADLDGYAQTNKDSLKILFVGNSYTYYEQMPKMVAHISNGTQTKLITQRSAPGGARLREHWLGLRGMKTKELIRKGNFDIVVLQGQSMAALRRPDTLKKYAKLFSSFIKRHNAKPYFYGTWARESTPKLQKNITRVYTEIASSNKGVFVPVGEAWAYARKLRPTIRLYARDGSHPNKLGAYLTASVFVATILSEIPKKSDNVKGLFPADKRDILFCKKVARRFIQM